MSAIALRGVSKHWTTAQGIVHAVHDLSFSLETGTLNVLLGPSGCGKSTTLRMIAGLEAISMGDLVIGGRRMNEVDPKDRDLAFEDDRRVQIATQPIRAACG